MLYRCPRILHQVLSGWRVVAVTIMAGITTAGFAAAQDVSGAAEPNAGRQERPVEVLSAVVVSVRGTVEWAPPGVSVLDGAGWTPVRLDDRLALGTQIRTGLRSQVNVAFGTTTLVSMRSATHASIDQLYRSADTEVVRIGLGYGTVRGGSTEGEMRSDVTVDSTVATLAKRGTEGWQMTVEPVTGRFRISLAQYGLVEAIKKLERNRQVSRSVRPGEYATQANIGNMWIQQDIFDRNVTFYQADAITISDAQFGQANTRGLSVIGPGGGTEVVDLSERVNAAFVLDRLAANAPPGTPPPTLAIIEPGTIRRPEGNFGTANTFRVLIPRATATPSLKRGLRMGWKASG